MKTVNSVSGGQTSGYVFEHYPADFSIFQLVRTNERNLLWMKGKDEKTRQIISDRLGMEFVGTLEDDKIIYTILDLEQRAGRGIEILTSKLSFEEMIVDHGDRYLPSPLRRYCTEELKIQPCFDWWLDKFNGEIVEMRIGYRANEGRRVKNMLDKCDDGILSYKHIIGQKETKTGIRNIWKTTPFQKPVFPLVHDKATFKDQIIEYWKDKPVRFAEYNNCVGCFHREELLLRHMFAVEPEKMELFASFERGRKYSADTLKAKHGITYDRISKMMQNHTFDFSDFNDCDSGYCGL